MKAVLSMRINAPMGNGNRKVGEVLATFDGNNLGEMIAEIKSAGNVDNLNLNKLKSGKVTLADGVQACEVFNAVNNGAISHLGKPIDKETESVSGPTIDPVLKDAEWRNAPLSSITSLNPDTLKKLDKAGLKTLGDIETHLAAGSSLEAITGAEIEAAILTHIAAIK